MTVLSSPTVKLNKRAKIMLSLVVTFFTIPLLVFVMMVIQGFVEGAGEKHPQDVVATRVSSSAATIAWVTTGKVSATVEYGTTPGSLQTYAPEVTATKEHEIDLTLLSPATTYYYQIRINGNEYNNSGVPWTFTTKTISGEEVVAAVKGATTKLSVAPSATPTPKLGTSDCDVTECSEIKAHLGKGCSASDYIQCIATASASVSKISITPIPTSVSIMSNKCKVLDLYVPSGGNCTNWSWTSYATHPATDCREAFYQYIVQCNSKDFNSTNTNDKGKWYFNDAITNRRTNSIELISEPPEDSTVYCQIRVEDSQYNASQWVSASSVCNY